MTFKVINGNPNAERNSTYNKEEMKDFAEEIRKEPETYMKEFGQDKEAILALADIYEKASQLQEDVTKETIFMMWDQYVKQSNYEFICEWMDKQTKPFDLWGMTIEPESVPLAKKTVREIMFDEVDPKLVRVMESIYEGWSERSNPINRYKLKRQQVLTLVKK
ncbi:hypothetical protein [Niallia taxi]|uniref:hypothetical protein n=1 Tax=Niallia taxi TaxID=2499688 RepID=UPI0015F560AC|nr:hypothetical protein [Niallia taxi]